MSILYCNNSLYYNNSFNRLHWECFLYFVDATPNLDYNYIFMIDLATNHRGKCNYNQDSESISVFIFVKNFRAHNLLKISVFYIG